MLKVPGWFHPPWSRRAAPPVHIGWVRHDPLANSVCAQVDGHPVWFQGEGAPLTRSPEAFAAAFLLAAAMEGRALTVETGLNADFIEACRRVMGVSASWWSHPSPVPGPVSARPAESADGAAASSLTLCFSGGVDSFYSLNRFRPDRLVMATGYDIPLENIPAWRSAETAAAHAASAAGIPIDFIRSNLREHPLIRRHSWERIHGGALIALGLLLRKTSGSLGISASYPLHGLHPWGTHPELDPLWSTGELAVRHLGADLDRVGKIRAVGVHPVFLENLRVCWEAPTAAGNCGRCEKCLRNRLVFSQVFPGVPCPAFPPVETLVADLDAMPKLPRPDLPVIYRRYLAGPADDPVRLAVKRLIERTTGHPEPDSVPDSAVTTPPVFIS